MITSVLALDTLPMFSNFLSLSLVTSSSEDGGGGGTVSKIIIQK
jgi:hypothetical protein